MADLLPSLVMELSEKDIGKPSEAQRCTRLPAGFRVGVLACKERHVRYGTCERNVLVDVSNYWQSLEGRVLLPAGLGCGKERHRLPPKGVRRHCFFR